LLAGLALPHLYFQAPGKKRRSVMSWKSGECEGFICPKCNVTTLLPDEPHP
jgi:hypothetical protein